MSSKQFSRAPSPRPPRGRGRASASRNSVSVLTYAGHLVPPLHWWRRLPAPAFTTVHLAVIRRAITGFGIIGESHWSAAAKGDPAAAVGVALRAIKNSRMPSPSLDLVMSALLRCAIAGDDAAIHTLTHVLWQMAADDPSCAQIAKSWQCRPSAERRRHMLRGG